MELLLLLEKQGKLEEKYQLENYEIFHTTTCLFA